MKLVDISRRLSRALTPLQFQSPVTHVYNPLDYARLAHEDYLRRYGRGPKQTILLGMNPGPFGMAQTGVPFGEVTMTREWLGIERSLIACPWPEHEKRRILGFECPRSEVSGRRVWSWARDRFGTPEQFFQRFFVVNYCPLVFLETSGKNRTPDKLHAAERQRLYDICDAALREVVDLLRPRFVVGIGRFAENRAQKALLQRDVTIGRILHPSPANPAANRDWAHKIERELETIGVDVN